MCVYNCVIASLGREGLQILDDDSRRAFEPTIHLGSKSISDKASNKAVMSHQLEDPKGVKGLAFGCRNACFRGPKKLTLAFSFRCSMKMETAKRSGSYRVHVQPTCNWSPVAWSSSGGKPWLAVAGLLSPAIACSCHSWTHPVPPCPLWRGQALHGRFHL